VRMAAFASRWWRLLGRNREQVLAENIVIGVAAFCVVQLTLSIPFALILWTLMGFANAARRCALAAERAADPPRAGDPALRSIPPRP